MKRKPILCNSCYNLFITDDYKYSKEDKKENSKIDLSETECENYNCIISGKREWAIKCSFFNKPFIFIPKIKDVADDIHDSGNISTNKKGIISVKKGSRRFNIPINKTTYKDR